MFLSHEKSKCSLTFISTSISDTSISLDFISITSPASITHIRHSGTVYLFFISVPPKSVDKGKFLGGNVAIIGAVVVGNERRYLIAYDIIDIHA